MTFLIGEGTLARTMSRPADNHGRPGTVSLIVALVLPVIGLILAIVQLVRGNVRSAGALALASVLTGTIYLLAGGHLGSNRRCANTPVGRLCGADAENYCRSIDDLGGSNAEVRSQAGCEAFATSPARRRP